MAERYISDILRVAGSLKTKKEKVEYLQAYNSRPLRTILAGAFDPGVSFNLPKGDPPYRKDDAPKGFEPSNLHKVTRRFKYFDKGGVGDSLSAARREKMFIDCLESLHPSEAELVLAMKNKKLGIKGITLAVVKEAFPSLIKGASKPVSEKGSEEK